MFSKTSEASLGPYAWQREPTNPVKRLKSTASGKLEDKSEKGLFDILPLEYDTTTSDRLDCQQFSDTSVWEDRYRQHPDLIPLQRSKDVFRKIEMDPALSLNLPRVAATAGRVLQHSVELFDKLHAKLKPMTFKFGITHDAAVRWHNAAFGYKHGKDKYDHMLVFYAASNCHGPAFLEAALIDRFGSSLFASTLQIPTIIGFLTI